jgi:MFS family permease
MALGIALSASGLLALAVVRGLGPFLVALAVTGVGVGLTYSVAVIATAHGVPESDTGQAEGITLTAMVIVAALAVTVGGMVIEAASGGGAPDQAGIDAALLLGAGVAAAALLVLLGGFLASRPPHQVHRATPRVFPIRRGP